MHWVRISLVRTMGEQQAKGAKRKARGEADKAARGEEETVAVLASKAAVKMDKDGNPMVVGDGGHSHA